MSQEKGFTFYQEIEEYLDRGRSQISNILGKLQIDNLIIREKDHSPQKIYLTSLGK